MHSRLVLGQCTRSHQLQSLQADQSFHMAIEGSTMQNVRAKAYPVEPEGKGRDQLLFARVSDTDRHANWGVVTGVHP